MEMSPSPGSFFEDDHIEREWKGTGGKLKKSGFETIVAVRKQNTKETTMTREYNLINLFPFQTETNKF